MSDRYYVHMREGNDDVDNDNGVALQSHLQIPQTISLSLVVSHRLVNNHQTTPTQQLTRCPLMKLHLQGHFFGLSYDVRDFDGFVGSVLEVVSDDHLEPRSLDKLLCLFHVGTYIQYFISKVIFWDTNDDGLINVHGFIIGEGVVGLVTFETNDDGFFHANVLCSVDDAHGDHIATHDTTENVHWKQ